MPVYPSSHKQLLMALLPALELEFSGHSTQSSSEIEPNCDE